MWILPKNLQLSSGAPDTAGFISDLNEQSQICASSLMARSKASPARTWLQKWKRDSWTQHLSGRILRPSHARTFVTEWTSLWPVTPASHFQQPGSDSEQKTLATSGHTSPDQYELFDLDYASLKMSKDTSALDSEKSLESWNKLVIQRRGEYSARVKSALRTSGSGSSSWPTIRASEYKDTGPIGSKSHDHMLGKGYLCAVVTQDAANWPTPDASNHRDGEVLRKDNNLEQGGFHGVSLHHAMTKYGQAAPASSSSLGSRQGLWPTITAHTPDMESSGPNGNSGTYLAGAVKQWATPRSGKTTDENPETWAKRQANGDVATMPLTAQVKNWATPANHDGTTGTKVNSPFKSLVGDVEKITPMTQGKLNPRFVETLMGLPVGWTMPSCASPVTIEPTNYDCSATESCLQQPSELFAF